MHGDEIAFIFGGGQLIKFSFSPSLVAVITLIYWNQKSCILIYCILRNFIFCFIATLIIFSLKFLIVTVWKSQSSQSHYRFPFWPLFKYHLTILTKLKTVQIHSSPSQRLWSTTQMKREPCLELWWPSGQTLPKLGKL